MLEMLSHNLFALWQFYSNVNQMQKVWGFGFYFTVLESKGQVSAT